MYWRSYFPDQTTERVQYDKGYVANLDDEDLSQWGRPSEWYNFICCTGVPVFSFQRRETEQKDVQWDNLREIREREEFERRIKILISLEQLFYKELFLYYQIYCEKGVQGDQAFRQELSEYSGLHDSFFADFPAMQYGSRDCQAASRIQETAAVEQKTAELHSKLDGLYDYLKSKYDFIQCFYSGDYPPDKRRLRWTSRKIR